MLEIPWVSGELDSSLRLRATGGTRISAWKRGREKSEARNSAVAISITGVIDEWITDQYSHQAPFWSYCSSSAHQARLAQEKWVLCALLYGAWWLLWDCQSWWARGMCFSTLLIWQNAPSLALYWHICSECLCLRRDGGDFIPFSAVVAVHFHCSTASPVVLLDHLSTACIFQIQYEINPQTYCHITVSKSE